MSVALLHSQSHCQQLSLEDGGKDGRRQQAGFSAHLPDFSVQLHKIENLTSEKWAFLQVHFQGRVQQMLNAGSAAAAPTMADTGIIKPRKEK